MIIPVKLGLSIVDVQSRCLACSFILKFFSSSASGGVKFSVVKMNMIT